MVDYKKLHSELYNGIVRLLIDNLEDLEMQKLKDATNGNANGTANVTPEQSKEVYYGKKTTKQKPLIID